MCKINLSIDLEEFIILFAGDKIKYIRPVVKEDEYRLFNPYDEHPSYITLHANADTIITETDVFMHTESNINVLNYSIYFIGVKDIIGNGYWLHPDYTAYGIVITDCEESAKFFFREAKQQFRPRYQPEPVVLSKITFEPKEE